MGRLIEAIQEGNDAAVAELLDSDPRNADERDENGVSALLQALYRGRGQIVNRIAEAKGWMDVFEAAAMGDAGRLELALKEQPDGVKAFSGDGFTALHLAAFFGHRLAANLLLLAGADPNAEAKNPMRVRPLHSAVAGPDPMMAEALVMMGAEVNAVQQGGFTALHAAAHRGDLQLTELLLGAGADPSARTDDGRSPSDLAREAGHNELAGRLDRITGAG
ncbi:MAG TPA: ankyrin repeat domain-containing protein [Actinomycetota bacterium]|nr:ankyrin repeat domain-containing protein [Actinomycetota bacterium]